MYHPNRDAIDKLNSTKMYPIAIEEQMRTNRWANRAFQFILGVIKATTMQLEVIFFAEEWKIQLFFGGCCAKR